MIVHLGTVIQSQFGVLDADGNVLPQEPMTAQVQVFDRAKFCEAFAAIRDARDKAAEAAESPEPDEPDEPPS